MKIYVVFFFFGGGGAWRPHNSNFVMEMGISDCESWGLPPAAAVSAMTLVWTIDTIGINEQMVMTWGITHMFWTGSSRQLLHQVTDLCLFLMGGVAERSSLQVGSNTIQDGILAVEVNLCPLTSTKTPQQFTWRQMKKSVITDEPVGQLPQCINVECLFIYKCVQFCAGVANVCFKANQSTWSDWKLYQNYEMRQTVRNLLWRVTTCINEKPWPTLSPNPKITLKHIDNLICFSPKHPFLEITNNLS